MPTHLEKRPAALPAGAALRAGSRRRPLPGVPALVQGGADNPARGRCLLCRPRHRIQSIQGAVLHSKVHLASTVPVSTSSTSMVRSAYLNNHWRFDPPPPRVVYLVSTSTSSSSRSLLPEPDRAPVQRSRASHGGCVRDPRAQAVHAGCDDIGPGRAIDRQTGHRVGLGRPPVAAALLGGAQTAQRIRCTAPVSPARSAACISTGRATAAIAADHAARRIPFLQGRYVPGSRGAPVTCAS